MCLKSPDRQKWQKIFCTPEGFEKRQISHFWRTSAPPGKSTDLLQTDCNFVAKKWKERDGFEKMSGQTLHSGKGRKRYLRQKKLFKRTNIKQIKLNDILYELFNFMKRIFVANIH